MRVLVLAIACSELRAHYRREQFRLDPHHRELAFRRIDVTDDGRRR
jgi:hypothetical protein